MSATTGAVRQGRAFVELFTDDTKLKQGLRVAENSLKKFGASVSKAGTGLMMAGAAILAPLSLAVREYTKAGSALKEMSDRTGVAVESLSALQYGLSQNGATLEDFEKGLRTSQKLLGSSLGAKVLGEMGVDIEKLKALSPEEQFMSLAEAISRLPTQVDRAAAAMRIFGKGGTTLLPFLSQGREGILQLSRVAGEKGLLWSSQDAAAADAFGDSIGEIRQQVLRLVANIGAALVPVLQDFGQWLSRVIPIAKDWVAANRPMIVMLAKAALAAVALGAALFAVGKIIALVAGAFAAMRVAVTVVSALWAVLTSGAAVLAFLRGAVIACTAAMGAAKVAIVGLGTASGIAQAIVAIWPAVFLAAAGAVLHFAGGFKEMGRVSREVIGGVSDALATGDIENAMRILWSGVKVIWTEGCNWIVKAFYDLVPVITRIVGLLSASVLTGLLTLKKAIRTALSDTVGGTANFATKLVGAYEMTKVNRDVQSGKITAEEGAARKQKIADAVKKVNSNADAERAAALAGDTEDVNAAAKVMNDRVDDFYKTNADIFKDLDAKAAKQRDELAALVSSAKDKRVVQDLQSFFAEIDKPRGAGGGWNVAGAQERANSVVGGFDIGARMSFQAGDSSNKLTEIAENTGRSAEALETMADNATDSGYGA